MKRNSSELRDLMSDRLRNLSNVWIDRNGCKMFVNFTFSYFSFMGNPVDYFVPFFSTVSSFSIVGLFDPTGSGNDLV